MLRTEAKEASSEKVRDGNDPAAVCKAVSKHSVAFCFLDQSFTVNCWLYCNVIDLEEREISHLSL